MELSEFKDKCMETAIRRDDCYNLLYASNALNGEAGELANMVKKLYRGDKNPPTREERLKEIFDMMWYCSYYIDVEGSSFEEVLGLGFSKLNERHKKTPQVLG